jgi:glutathione S-transferase
MTTPHLTLYQFPISFYCEKIHWQLDAKGLPYTLRNLVPGLHRRVTKRLAGRTTVPVLVDGATALGDSAKISLYLENTYPAVPLLPPPGPERERARELETWFGDAIGPHVRRWVYGHIIQGKADLGAFMFAGYDAPQVWLRPLLAPVLKRVLPRVYSIYPPQVEESRVKILEGLDRLEREIGGDPSRYLVGSSLSLADITVASIYAGLVTAEGSPYAARPDLRIPKAIGQMVDEVRARPGGQWVLRRYQQDRASRRG